MFYAAAGRPSVVPEHRQFTGVPAVTGHKFLRARVLRLKKVTPPPFERGSQGQQQPS